MSGLIGPSDESFLPQIIGIFYAVFDPHRGPIVTNQVPENLVTTGAAPAAQLSQNASDPSLDPTLTSSVSSLSSSASVPPPQVDRGRRSHTNAVSAGQTLPVASSSSSIHQRSPAPSPARSSSQASHRTSSFSPSRTHRSLSIRSASPAFNPYAAPGNPPPNTNNPAFPSTLLNFSLLSDYIIPRSALKHRLVTCISGRFQVLGFPCVIDDERYERNELKWNLAFVFDRRADLSAFEPVVRKCGRLLRACELDTKFLSLPGSATHIQTVIEQLFEDLNSYSETSILVDRVNGIEIKLFPFHPNPPLVEDWHVPVPLVDLSKLREANWDLMAAKVAGFIDGVNHAGRIAQLADADPRITRLCLQHFLYHQVIAMIDIFQFSNMYTVKPSIQRITREDTVAAECGVYVTREFHPIPSWPVLLQLYAKLQPGISISLWMEQNRTEARGIDVRRFVTFGVIKGFLRRVHRWPILVEPTANSGAGDSGITRGGSESFISPGVEHNRRSSHSQAVGRMSQISDFGNNQTDGSSANMESAITLRSSRSNNSLGGSPTAWRANVGDQGRMSGAGRSGTSAKMPTVSSSFQSFGTEHRNSAGLLSTSHITSSSTQPGQYSTSGKAGAGTYFSQTSRSGTAGQATLNQAFEGTSQPSNASAKGNTGGPARQAIISQRRPRRSSFRSAPGLGRSSGDIDAATLEKIKLYLDGNHHADEIQTKFKMSWKRLEACLRKAGGMHTSAGNEADRDGSGDGGNVGGLLEAGQGHYGNVVIVFR